MKTFKKLETFELMTCFHKMHKMSTKSSVKLFTKNCTYNRINLRLFYINETKTQET